MSAATVPSPRGSALLSRHLRQIDAKLARELMQHAAADERHDDHEEDLVRMALRVPPYLAQEVAQLVVEVLEVAVARGALVARGGRVVARGRRVRGAGPGAGVAGARGRGAPVGRAEGVGEPAHGIGVVVFVVGGGREE